MNHKQKEGNKHPYLIGIYVLIILLLLVFEIIDIQFSNNALVSTMIQNISSRILLGLLFVTMLIHIGYANLLRFNNPYKSLIIIIPGIIIAINNFPIIAYFDGRTTLNGSTYTVFLFMIECLTVGFFEEIVFRVIILLLLLQKLPETKKGVLLAIIISSAIFGLTHIINLFSGASLGNTVLQVGYSFLVGMMWAVMYLKTNNLWFIMLLHALYNFFGLVLFNLGTVVNRYDIFTIIITIVLGLLVTLYSIKLFRELPEKPLMI